MKVGTAPLKFSVGVKISSPAAFRLTLPLATATAAPPAVIGVPLTAVMVRAGFSNVSLPSTEIVTAVSSAVEAVSSAMSATGVTVIATLSVSVRLPSLVSTVRVAAPLKSAVLV